MDEDQTAPTVEETPPAAVQESPADRKITQERELADQALAEFDGLAEGVRRLSLADRHYADQVGAELIGLGLQTGRVDPREPGARDAGEAALRLKSQIRDRLEDYLQSAIGLRTSPEQVRLQLGNLIQQLATETNLEISQQLVDQAIAGFQAYLNKVNDARGKAAGERGGMDGITVKTTEEVGQIKARVERQSAKRLGEGTVINIARKCLQMSETLQRESTTVGRKDEQFSGEAARRKTAFVSRMGEILQLKGQVKQSDSI